MLFKQRKPKGFHYEPRFGKDGEKKPQKKFEFSRTMPSKASGGRSFIFMLVLIVLDVYLVIFFRRFKESPPDTKFEVENIIVE